ncbi:hypothetical protein SBF1_3390006 [Candidatus Desulfosporosinus infrequens]|uniref:Uncharacterized protein n=1 Tax=Candidatus Desulfosporosinus infrequens TaxID=2043169 RepID=A0A2U3L1E2_9FIRM|nr:hypothetical protein SBF1_3390006 [Candidatus Desulfosporosinus infrequens]
MAPDKVAANNASNKAKRDYSHDSDGKECDLDLHVQNHKHDIFPAYVSPHTLCISVQIFYITSMLSLAKK